ncbi:MAG: UDP-N-acetylmuramate dehydrogenase [Chlamydiia bacterium]|nr:UDP-N-acetylmuramate dehydrogenase [Chlamydiia bacterium]
MSIEARIQSNRSLKELSTLGIGGPARYFIAISATSEMIELMKYLKLHPHPYWVIGKGSNSLFSDRGFDGLIILNQIQFLEWEEGLLHVGAGFSFSLLGAKTARKGWGGLEFASGIPGTVGGAIYMNAGANGKETADHLVEVTVVTPKGKLLTRKKEDLKFSYRTSIFQKEEGIIVSARFQLMPKPSAREEQLQIIDYRTKTQPYGEKSAGCFFRNPKGKVGAGALIEQCGLKGKRIGGAEVSTLHGNFIINRGEATTEDVLQLVKVMKQTVFEQTGQSLELEIRPIPYRLEEG